MSTSIGSSQVHPSSARRARHRTSTAATEDGSQTPARNSSSTANTTSLPDFEPPVAPLNNDARQALKALLQSNTATHLKNHLRSSGEMLTENAGLINDRLTDARVRLEKRKEKGGGDEAERKEVEELEKEVGELTGKLEGKMRDVVDAEVKVDDLGVVVKELGRECDAEAEEVQRRERRRRQRQQQVDGEDEEDEEDEDVDMQDAEEDSERKVQSCPSQKMQEKIAEKKTQWEDLPLTERYAIHPIFMF